MTGAVVVAELASTALKLLLGRPRPFASLPDPAPLVETTLDVGLPSGHAATSFAAALTLALLAPRLAIPAFLLAAAIAWSRVYVGVHWPSDLLLGAIVGLASAGLVWFTAPRMLGAIPRRSRRGPPPG